ncbi:hypothetical protein Pst134EA_021221 [Puccinia striiformis f. sp. tritici]|uniref:hypothetical protein n=1 Tax=Puccinia striiformis f. sp. tritici TaxID=168172 RepID=UPI0020074CE0|nr:hypothetical protein Pst134EA_021221 [Puccinia striiformis f. sp. tritici]KAH9457338.1 hypothetical protein Pst134EA_021221 [Puccinia striiformis f. sp. tritici]
MRSIGIHEDLIQIIRKGYDESLIQCRLGDNLSEPFTQSITEGIEVPGLKEPVKGLLFADDTLIFADNKRQIESICKRLDKYCSKWHFALGYEKCGVVEYNPKLGAVLEHPTFQLAKGQIKSMDTYKYLGCFIPNKLEPKEEYVMENEHSKLLARKAENCMHASSALLHDQWIHLLAKTRIIQTYIMAAGTYGAEWIGMNQKRTRRIQSVIGRASRLAYGKKDNNQTLNTLLLSLELDIPPVSIHCAVQRIRLWNKGEDLRTILKDLIEHPPQGAKNKIWVQNTPTNLAGYVNRIREWGITPFHYDESKTCMWIRDMRTLKLKLHPKVPSPIGDKQVVMDKQYAQQMHAEKIQIHLSDLEVARESKRSKAVARYDQMAFGRTANFIATSLILPDLVEGVTSLSLLRMNALPSVGRRITTLNALKIPHTLKRAECPYCRSKIVGQQEEWMHIILDCDTFKDTRARTIQLTIEYLLERVAGTGITAKRHVYILLQGGLVRSHYPLSLNKDPTNDDHYLETAYGEEDLCQWVNGYRHIPDLYPNKLLGGHGYANVVRFLQGTVPKVTRILYDVGTAVITDDFEGFANDEGNTGNKAAVQTCSTFNAATPDSMSESNTSSGVG